MSKLIVEMEMPKCCLDCACCDSEYGYCSAIKKQIDDLNKRPSWCPICGVLPDEHGDLIDRDALLEKYNVKDTNIAECLTDKKMERAFERFCIIADALEAAPTVIAAERKDDGNI